jgi:phage anti-repressor protein
VNIIKEGNRNLISARDLYVELGIKRDYSTWIKQSIERADLELNRDFTPFKGESTGGRPTVDYLLVKDAALAVIMMSGGKFASKLRKTVIELYNQHDTGLAFNVAQIEALMDLSKAMTLVSIQKEVQRNHYAIYNQTGDWYNYRAALLGYSKERVIEAMRNINKKYRSIRQSFIHLDANELIRMGVVDFMMAMGKTEEYALNVGGLCKSMAKKMELGNTIWDDTKDNPLEINQKEVTERKNKYNTALTLL